MSAIILNKPPLDPALSFYATGLQSKRTTFDRHVKNQAFPSGATTILERNRHHLKDFNIKPIT